MPSAFNRRESPTQTPEIAVKQVASGEIWGRRPMGGMTPTVQAYIGPLQDGRRGIEFDTAVALHPNGSPIEARWYLGITVGVQQRFSESGEEFACIPASVTNLQLEPL